MRATASPTRTRRAVSAVSIDRLELRLPRSAFRTQGLSAAGLDLLARSVAAEIGRTWEHADGAAASAARVEVVLPRGPFTPAAVAEAVRAQLAGRRGRR